jgi:aromatic ring-opening dioxygenase LigB subunit
MYNDIKNRLRKNLTKEVNLMAWIWAALMPHPPIIVPGVGRGREREAEVTLKGVAGVTERLKDLGAPDRILLLSPHQPYAAGAFAINRARLVKGGLSPFGASVSFELNTHVTDAEALAGYLKNAGAPVGIVEAAGLDRDQGSTVPLYFLRECYGVLPGVILSNPIGLDANQAFELGRSLASFDDGAKWGLLASGDLSHRLKPGAPAGYSPMGEKFDRAVVESLERADAAPLLDMPPHAIEDAGECGMRSALAMIGMASSFGGKIEVLSYEGPYGVGYCNAVWIP